MSLKFLSGLVLILGLLNGCASTTSLPPASDQSQQRWLERQQQLKQIKDWKIRGRFAVKTGDKGGQATVIWDRQNHDHQMIMYGPMGAGKVLLNETPKGANLTDSKKRTYQDRNAEDLLYRVVGWEIPFTQLQWWLVGLPAVGSDYELKLDGQGRIHSLNQNGWRIDFKSYRDIDGIMLPRKVFMVADGKQGSIKLNDRPKVLRVRMIIKRWTL